MGQNKPYNDKPKPYARVALSVDLEDFYHANYPGYDYREMISSPSHLIEPTEIMLDLLEKRGYRVTFFVLGEVAKLFPLLIKKISHAGHEIASHGESHRLITELGPEKTIQDLRRSVGFLEDITGCKVNGYRAPNYSAHPKRTPWLFAELIRLGLIYDSSRCPAKTYYSGEPNMSKLPFLMELPGTGSLWEIPVSCSGPKFFRFIWAGGFYWRILPLNFIIKKIRHLIANGKPAILYLHPKDIDPENPSLPIGRISNWIHQVGTKKGEKKLDSMLSRVECGRIIDIIPKEEYGKKQREKEKNRIATETAMV